MSDMKKKTRMALKGGYELTITTAKEKVAAQMLVNQDSYCAGIDCDECPMCTPVGMYCLGLGDLSPRRFDKFVRGIERQAAILNEMGYK